MVRCGVPLLLVAALVGTALGGPVPAPGRTAAPAPRSPLDLLDDHTRSLAPDMADPLPPARHKAARPGRARAANRVGDDDPYRLPKALRPVLYQVEITPNFDDFTFSGDVLMVINCLETTNTITLHSKDIVIDDSAVQIGDDRTGFVFTDLASLTYDKEHDFAILTPNAPLRKGGRYRIYIPYTGKLNDDLDGFYRSSYKTSSGETRWLATTQFEEDGARRAFPCWDDPSYKARFYIIINHDKNRGAISNMPTAVPPAQTVDGHIQEQFDGTLPMSTYLVAFIVSDFGSLTNDAGNFTLWVRKDLLKGGQFSQDVGQKALQLLGDYTGIPYALPKEDQAAIPDFAAGAMENWGLVTYREEYLIEQDTQTIRIAEYMMTTICHELGHQWTGDLVTLDWWSHTWLNEGFADYFENFICNQMKPELHLRDKGVVGDHHLAMESDAVETQYAMSSPVSTPRESSDKFDRISYSKGGAVIRMWEYFLGLDVLKAGMHRYLSINMFRNAVPESLFKAIDIEAQKAGVLPSGLSFPEIARTWTEQPGVPVVTAARDYDKNAVVLSQQRFFYQPPNRASLVNQRWHIPVTVVEEASADWDALKPTVWLGPDAEKTTLKVAASSSQWVLLNPKEIGYYRVNYDVANWKLLSAALAKDSSVLPSATRAQLINDAMALARGAQLDYAVALPFLNLLKTESEVAPWQSGVTALSYLRAKLAGTDAWPSFLTLLKKLTGPTFSAVGYSGSSDHETRFVRYYVASYACYAGLEDCVAKAGAALQAWLADPNTKWDPDTKAVSLCYGLRSESGAVNFNDLKIKWLQEKDPDARAALLTALACAQPEALTGLLTDSINNKLGDSVTQNEVVSLWSAILNRPEQQKVLFDFAKNNFKQIDSYFSSSDANSGAIKLLSNCILAITSTEDLNDARWWVEDNYKGQDGYNAMQDAFLKTYINLDWYRTNYKAVADWVKAAASA